MVSLVDAGNGISSISVFYMNSITSKLHRYEITSTIEIVIGVTSNNLNDLTTVALELKNMVCNATKAYNQKNNLI